MLRVRKLDIFILKSFISLFIGTFFICLFIFMMQFLWKYVDDLVGKGLEMSVMAQFFFYSALTLVPLAMPLAVLLASLITFGNFGERYELLAMKAAGISLLKIMRPLIVFVSGLVAVSFYFQNVIAPEAQAKFGMIFVSLKQKSPELDIPEGVFYSEIPDYNLKIAKKNRDSGMMYDVLIYNMKDGFENAHIIYADSGKMEMTADKQHLWLHLYDGDLFENLKTQSMNSQSVPYRRESFREKHTIIEFNSDFNMADQSITKNMSSAKNMLQLDAAIDSMKLAGDSIGRQYYQELSATTYGPVTGLTKQDTVKILKENLRTYDIDSLLNAAPLLQKQRIYSAASNRTANLQTDLSFKIFSMGGNEQYIRRHKIEWHKKITISLSCLLFFFIGASLGGIIRKGGLGMPVIISVLMFIIYYIIDNTGYKMSRDGKWIIWMGMWTSTAVLLSLGVFFTYKSNKDSVVLNADAYIHWIRKIIGIRNVRHLIKKEVVINDPDYNRIPHDLEELSAACRDYAQENRLLKAPNYFSMWMSTEKDDKIRAINDRLEQLVDELSNTKSVTLLSLLNKYPIIPVSAHITPFKSYWLNLLAGVVVPVGLFFYFRIWAFRVRLSKDMDRIIKNNEEINTIIHNNK